jgi:hypothetical protein
MAVFTNGLNNLSNELNETTPHKYHFAYIDKNVDARLFYMFNARLEPAVYIMDPDTEKVYAMDSTYN